MKKLILLFLSIVNFVNGQSNFFRYDSTLVESSLLNINDCSYYSQSLKEVMVVTNSDSSIFTMTSDPSGTQPFLNESKIIYALDSSRKILSQTYQYGDSSRWVNNYKDTFTYDSVGNIDTKTVHLWSNFHFSWINYELDSMVHSVSDTITRYAEYSWDTLLSTWHIRHSIDKSFNANNQLLESTDLSFFSTGAIYTGMRSICNYDVNGLCISSYTLEYNTVFSYWENVNGNEAYYDAAGRDTMLIYLTGDSTSWTPDRKYVKIYNGSGLLFHITNSSWTGGNWLETNRTIYEYNTNNQDSLETTQTYNGITWLNSGLVIQTHSPSNKILERLTQTWDGTAWLNQTVYHFTYDIQDSCTESLLSIWDSGSWLDGSKSITIYYSYFPLSYYSADQFYDVSLGWQTENEGTISYDTSGNVLSFWFVGNSGMSNGSKTYSYYPDGKLRHVTGYSCSAGGLGDKVDRNYYHLMQTEIQLNPSIACQGDSILAVISTTGDNNPSHYSWSPGLAVSDSTISQPYLFPSVSTDYYLTVRDDSGSVSIREITTQVSVSTKPNIGPDTTICAGVSYTLDAGNQFQSYEWQDGSSQTFFTVNENIPGAYYFWVLVQDSNQCTNSDTVAITVDVCSGLIALNNSNLNYFPNPVNDRLCIQNTTLQTQNEISLFNSQGDLVKQYFINADNKCIVTSDLPEGIYYYKYVQQNGSVTGNKIIILH